jgi:hypothetical protein
MFVAVDSDRINTCVASQRGEGLMKYQEADSKTGNSKCRFSFKPFCRFHEPVKYSFQFHFQTGNYDDWTDMKVQ